MTWLLAALALVGFSIAAYFCTVTYGWMRPDASLVPRFCRMEGDTCQTVIQAPEASLYGLPNSVYGSAYYAVILAWLATRPWPILWEAALLAAGGWTVLLGTYLVYALQFRLRVPCPLCMTAHAINLSLAIGLASMMPSG